MLNSGEPAPRESWRVRLLPLWAALGSMAPFVGVLTGRTEFYHDDHFRFTAPIASMVADALRAGHLPLWNPWVLTGTPLVAERGSMVAHPGMLLTLVMEPSHAVGVLSVLLLGVLAAGATALLRALAVRPVLALAVGAALGLSGPAISYTGNPPFLGTLAFWPLVLLGAVRLGRGQGSAIASGLALGMALLGGDLPGALLAALVALFVFRAAGGSFRRQWLALAATGGIALLAGGAGWYPVVWALPLSERGAGIVASQAGRWSFHPGEVLGFFWPHPLGLPLPRFTFWPFRWLGDERLFLHSVWVGALLAGASLLALRRGGSRVARTFVLVALVLVVVATGKWTWLWPLFRPIFTYLRYPSKLVAPAALLVALAGAVAFETLLEQPKRLRHLCLAVAAMGLLGLTVGVHLQSVLARSAGATAEVVADAASALRAGTLRVVALALLGVGLCALLDRGRLSLRRAGALMSLLLFLDVFATTADLTWTRPNLALARPGYLPDVGPRGPRVMRLGELNNTRLALSEQAFSDEQYRLAAMLSPLANAPFHVGVLDPYGLYMNEVAVAMTEFSRNNPVALAEVSGSDLLLASAGARASWLVDAVANHALVPVTTIAAGAVVLRPAHALPRSYLASAASLAGREAIPGLLVRDRNRLLIASERGMRAGAWRALDANAVPASILASPDQAVVAVAPTAWRPGEAAYRVAVPAPAVLVEMEAFMPGWRVYVDGQEQTLLQANAFGHAVVVPAGAHQVVFRFFPRLVVASLFASWLTLVAGALVLLVRRRHRLGRQTEAADLIAEGRA